MRNQMDLTDRITESTLSSMIYPRWANLDLESHELWVRVWKGVFDPTFGLTTKYLIQTLLREQYDFHHAFDMGCGTGAIAIEMVKSQIAKKVDAFELSKAATRNAKWNVSYNHKCQSQVKVVCADLFMPIGQLPLSGEIYDGGVFNHPYLPESRAQAKWQDPKIKGGEALIRRFLIQARKFMFKNSPIIMPYSSLIPEVHNPAIIAQDLGMKCREVAHFKDTRGAHYIFEIRV